MRVFRKTVGKKTLLHTWPNVTTSDTLELPVPKCCFLEGGDLQGAYPGQQVGFFARTALIRAAAFGTSLTVGRPKA